MTAAGELLINLLMAVAAVGGGEVTFGNDEAVMFFLFLRRRSLMAVETTHALLGVRAHFIFVHDRILGAGVTFGALARGADESSFRLFGLGFGVAPGL